MLSFYQQRLWSGVLALSFIGALSYGRVCAVADEIVIDNSQTLRTGFVSAPLVTIRPVTRATGGAVLASLLLSKDLLVRSATAFPEVKEELRKQGITDPSAISMNEFVSVLRSSDYSNQYLYRAGASKSRDKEYPVTQ